MIKKFIKRFFKQVEETPVLPPSEDELVDGQAFKIKHYPLKYPLHARSNDTLTITINLPSEGVDVVVEEKIGEPMYIDTISTVRFNDSLGYKHAIGALFGQRNN